MKNQERIMAQCEVKDFPEVYIKTKLDFTIEDHGSITLFRPNNKTAKDWLRLTSPEDAMFLGGAMAVEPRYVEGVVLALSDDGFSVSIT